MRPTLDRWWEIHADLARALVDELVKRLIARPPESIAMTKRLANRAVVQHLNLTLDAVAYAEWLELPAVVALQSDGRSRVTKK
jgi:enoyl-CoA hydratase/carnithine racemase